MQAPTQPMSEEQLINLECFFDGAAQYAKNPELASLDLSDFEPIKVEAKIVSPAVNHDAVVPAYNRSRERLHKKSEADILFA